MATRSSDDWIRAEILLASTLRYLAGGSFIDLVDLYQLPKTNSHSYIYRTLHAIDDVIDNIKLPQIDMEWNQLACEWKDKLHQKYPSYPHLLKGTVLVTTDGIIIETTCPLETECRGNYVGNMIRKGFLKWLLLMLLQLYF